MINHIVDPRLNTANGNLAKRSPAVKAAANGMMDGYAEFTVLMPVSQYVKIEADALEHSRPLDSTASFLLSNWVMATRGRIHGPSQDNASAREAAPGGPGAGSGNGRRRSCRT